MLRPQPETSCPRDALVERDDVHLGVVEERVRVQVRRAEREPAVVDDADLRVHVHGIAQVSFARVDRAREEARRLVGGVDERGDLSARDVGAVVRACGQQDEDAEVVARRVLQLVREDRDDLRRPEELVLEVDEALCRAKRAEYDSRIE